MGTNLSGLVSGGGEADVGDAGQGGGGRGNLAFLAYRWASPIGGLRHFDLSKSERFYCKWSSNSLFVWEGAWGF